MAFSGVYMLLSSNSAFSFSGVGSYVGYFLDTVGTVLAIQCTVLFIKNDKKYLDRLGKAMFLRHSFSWCWAECIKRPSPTKCCPFMERRQCLRWVSFLLQTAVIAPPLLMFSLKLRKPHNHTSSLNLAAIVAPIVVANCQHNHIRSIFSFLPRKESRYKSISVALMLLGSYFIILRPSMNVGSRLQLLLILDRFLDDISFNLRNSSP